MPPPFSSLVWAAAAVLVATFLAYRVHSRVATKISCYDQFMKNRSEPAMWQADCTACLLEYFYKNNKFKNMNYKCIMTQRGDLKDENGRPACDDEPDLGGDGGVHRCQCRGDFCNTPKILKRKNFRQCSWCDSPDRVLGDGNIVRPIASVILGLAFVGSFSPLATKD